MTAPAYLVEGQVRATTKALGKGATPLLKTTPLRDWASAALVTVNVAVTGVKSLERLDTRKTYWATALARDRGGAKASVVVIAPVVELLSNGTLRLVTPPITLAPPSLILKASISGSPGSTAPLPFKSKYFWTDTC